MRVFVGVLFLWTSTVHASGIRGRVLFSGALSGRAPQAVAKDAAACGTSQPDESLLVGDHGGLRNAVVFLEDAQGAPPAAAAKISLDQSGCRYHPHVLVAQIGTELEVKNSDPILHNVNAAGVEGHTAFNWAFPMLGQQRRTVLSAPGLLHAQCNAGHPWMSAWIYVFNHTFFSVTDVDGAFLLEGVAPGPHSLAVWHERLGVKHIKIDVPAQGLRVDPVFATKQETSR